MIKIDPKRKLWQEVLAYTLLTVGSLLFAIGDVMFVNPYLMAPGGTYGLSNVFNTLWPWKISLYAICMDIPLLIIGTWILGPKFGIKTIVSTALIFLFTFVLESWWGYNPVIHDGGITATVDPSMRFLITVAGSIPTTSLIPWSPVSSTVWPSASFSVRALPVAVRISSR